MSLPVPLDRPEMSSYHIVFVNGEVRWINAALQPFRSQERMSVGLQSALRGLSLTLSRFVSPSPTLFFSYRLPTTSPHAFLVSIKTNNKRTVIAHSRETHSVKPTAVRRRTCPRYHLLRLVCLSCTTVNEQLSVYHTDTVGPGPSNELCIMHVQ